MASSPLAYAMWSSRDGLTGTGERGPPRPPGGAELGGVDGWCRLQGALVIEQVADQPVGAPVALARDVLERPAIKAHQHRLAAVLLQDQGGVHRAARGPEAI